MSGYKESQSGWHFVVIFITLAIVAFAVIPMDTFGLPHYMMLALLIACCVVFSSLTIEVNRGWIKCYFGQGLIGREIPLRDVASCEPIRVPWYWGWGIRWTPWGWMYNIRGSKAVRLRLKNGRGFLMGSDEPDLVCEVIREEMAKLAG